MNGCEVIVNTPEVNNVHNEQFGFEYPSYIDDEADIEEEIEMEIEEKEVETENDDATDSEREEVNVEYFSKNKDSSDEGHNK